MGIPSGQLAKKYSFLNVGGKDTAEGRPAYSVATHSVRLSLWSASSFKSRSPSGKHGPRGNVDSVQRKEKKGNMPVRVH